MLQLFEVKSAGHFLYIHFGNVRIWVSEYMTNIDFYGDSPGKLQIEWRE